MSKPCVPASSRSTRARISASDWPAMRAALIAADFMGRPANGAGAQLDGPCPEALTDPQVQRGAGVARLPLDAATAEDRGGIERMRRA